MQLGHFHTVKRLQQLPAVRCRLFAVELWRNTVHAVVRTFPLVLQAQALRFCSPPGRFQSVNGSRDCIDCPVNTFQDQTGESSCKRCAPGTETGLSTGLSKCKPCKDGAFGTDGTCSACPQGGERKESVLNSDGSFIGKYSQSGPLVGATQCTNCEIGRYMAFTGWVSESSACCSLFDVAEQGPDDCTPCAVSSPISSS